MFLMASFRVIVGWRSLHSDEKRWQHLRFQPPAVLVLPLREDDTLLQRLYRYQVVIQLSVFGKNFTKVTLSSNGNIFFSGPPRASFRFEQGELTCRRSARVSDSILAVIR